jgi:D-beta-D-heptose 7-phosphate kinase/D-beta-D-heptose 1-phosphate adenosyltransferase
MIRGFMFASPMPVLDAIEHGFGARRVLVVGDVMLDRHLWGAVSRVSPEAPVPVVRYQRETASPGGAGNVALNLAALGMRVSLCGLVGDDAAGRELAALLSLARVDATGLRQVAGRPTTVKTRIIGGHQQMLRLDTEDPSPPPAEAVAALAEDAAARAVGAAAVVISDYAKGAAAEQVCRRVIAAARAATVPVLVDPKGTGWEKYRGATTLTPNRGELAAVARAPVASFAEAAAEGGRLAAELGLGWLTLTLSEEGIARIGPHADEEPLRIATLAREVFDVSGAGDTVIATLAAGLAARLDRDDAIRLANLAAGVVVGKVGTVPITHDELLAAALAESERSHRSKICELPHLLRRVKLWRARGERIVFTNGCFDILHAGHVSYLEGARRLGDRLLVALNTDRSVRALKGEGRPVNREADRALVISSLASVDAVVFFDDDKPLRLLAAIRPDVLAKGADYTIDGVVGAREVQAWGGRVELVPMVPGLSTTALIARAQAGRPA